MIERAFDTDTLRSAFCRGRAERKQNEHVKPRYQAVEDHFGDSLKATAELGFRAGFEKAIGLAYTFDPSGLKAEDVPKYLAAWLTSIKDW